MHFQIRLKRLQNVLNMDILVVGTLNQLFTRGSYTEKNVQKTKSVLAKIRSL